MDRLSVDMAFKMMEWHADLALMVGGDGYIGEWVGGVAKGGCTAVQKSQELGRKHWATCSSIRLYDCTTHSFACSFTHLFARSLTYS